MLCVRNNFFSQSVSLGLCSAQHRADLLRYMSYKFGIILRCFWLQILPGIITTSGFCFGVTSSSCSMKDWTCLEFLELNSFWFASYRQFLLPLRWLGIFRARNKTPVCVWMKYGNPNCGFWPLACCTEIFPELPPNPKEGKIGVLQVRGPKWVVKISILNPDRVRPLYL